MSGFLSVMTILTPSFVFGGDWQIVDLPFAIQLPPHPTLNGDARVVWQPVDIGPGYVYSSRSGTNSEYLQELENFRTIARQDSRPLTTYPSEMTLVEEHLLNSGFKLVLNPPSLHQSTDNQHLYSSFETDPSDSESQAEVVAPKAVAINDASVDAKGKSPILDHIPYDARNRYRTPRLICFDSHPTADLKRSRHPIRPHDRRQHL